MKNYLIYIIEDDRNLNKLISSKLKRSGYQTLSAYSGQEAVNCFRSRSSENIIMIIDYKLPDMTAKELVQSLKPDPEKYPFIIVTGQGREEIAVDMMKLGAKDYITKNTNIFRFLPAVIEKTVQDLSTRKKLVQAEDNAYQSELSLHTILDNIADAVIATNNQGKITRINPAAAGLTGWEKEKATGEQLGKVFKAYSLRNKKKEKITFNKLAAGKFSRAALERVILTDSKNHTFPILFKHKKIPYRKSKTCAAVLTFQDMSEKEKKEMQLRQAQKMEAIGLLDGGIAHDFNNMLGAIHGYATVLKEKKQKTTAAAKYLNSIINIAEQGSDITSQLLSYSSQRDIGKKESNIHQIITEVITILSHSLNKKIKINRKLAAAYSYTNCDSAYLRQVFMNLAINSKDVLSREGKIDFITENAKLRPRFMAKHNLDRSCRYIKITISDNGPGISEKNIKKIFEPFFSTKRKSSNTGLGLATVYGIVKKLNGAITVESKPYKNTSFTIFLPVKNKKAASRPPALKKIHKGTGNILVVDDDTDILNIMVIYLQKAGYTCQAEKKPSKAINEYKKNYSAYKLVILDMNMPQYDGLDCFKKFQKINPDLKCIILTGYSEPKKLQQIADRGVNAILTKPVNAASLTRKVKQVIKNN